MTTIRDNASAILNLGWKLRYNHISIETAIEKIEKYVEKGCFEDEFSQAMEDNSVWYQEDLLDSVESELDTDIESGESSECIEWSKEKVNQVENIGSKWAGLIPGNGDQYQSVTKDDLLSVISSIVDNVMFQYLDE